MARIPPDLIATVQAESLDLAVNRGILTHPLGEKESDFRVPTTPSIRERSDAEVYGNYQYKDQQTQQTKFNHRRVKIALEPSVAHAPSFVSVAASMVITKTRRIEAISLTIRKGSIIRAWERMEIRSVCRISPASAQ